MEKLSWLDSDGADFEFCGLGDGVVTGAGEDIDVGFGEAEAGENRSPWGAGGGFHFDFDLASAGGHFDKFPIGKAPVFYVVGVDLEGFFGEEVVDAAGASGLGARVVSLESAAGGQPDGVVGVDDLGGVAVADDFEEPRFPVFERLFMKNGGARVVFFGDGPLVDAVADVVPVEAFVYRAQSAELVEDVLGGLVFEAGGAKAFGDFGNDPPVGFGIAITWDGGAEALDPAFGVSLHAVGLAPGGGWEDDVGHLRGLGEEDVDDDEVVERLQGFLAVVFIGVGDDGVFAIDEHGVDAIFFQAAEIERGDLGHGIAKVEVGLLVGGPEFHVGFLGNDRLEAGVVVGDRSAVACALDVVLPAHRVDSGAYLTKVAGEKGEVAE